MIFSNDVINLAFLGTPKIEFLLYISKILSAIGKKVIVIDATKEQNLKYSIPEVIEKDVISFKGVDYLLNKGHPTEFETIDLDTYDIALIDYGFNQELSKYYNQSKYIFVFTNQEKQYVMKTKDLLTTIKGKQIIKIYKDLVNSKFNTKYIDNILDINNVVEVISEYYFSLDEQDYKIKLNSQYDDNFVFSNLSKDYKAFISDLLDELYQINIKDSKKIIKIVGRGKKNADSLLEYSSRSNSDNN